MRGIGAESTAATEIVHARGSSRQKQKTYFIDMDHTGACTKKATPSALNRRRHATFHVGRARLRPSRPGHSVTHHNYAPRRRRRAKTTAPANPINANPPGSGALIA